MFRLHLLNKNPNIHLLKQLAALRLAIKQRDRIGFFHQSAVNKRSSVCESRPTTGDGMETNSLSALKHLIREQADLVRHLKESGTSETELKTAIHELLRRKQELLNREREPNSIESYTLDRNKFDILVRRRFIYDQSYEIYGGSSGLYDLGPIGCAIKTNLLQIWRRFFVLHDQMLEIDCPALTIEPVFKASGHIERFSDYLVRDVVTHECFRVDHLIKTHLNELALKKPELEGICNETITKLDGAAKQELQAIMEKYKVKSPTTGNQLTEPAEFNLMFNTQMGSSNLIKGFLRPETSQGIFVNFKRLLDYNHGQLPITVAQIGNAFRNEIAPKSGLLRVREFTMAEIEHFIDPNEKTHAKFRDVADTKMVFYPANYQISNQRAKDLTYEALTIGEAVENGLVANENLGYFLARIHQFLVCVGVSSKYLRFRQHMPNEMAHYAVDCWDAEALTSHGWIECVGCADRSAYDLKQHTKSSGIQLTVERRLAAPKEVIANEIVPTKEFLMKLSNKKGRQVTKMLASLNQEQQNILLEEANQNGFFELSLDDNKLLRFHKSSFEVRTASKLVHVVEITPNVIEPSFGIGRILYTVLEHNFKKRDGDSNSYFALPALIAAHKCSILPLNNKPEFQPIIKRISSLLLEEDVSHKIDDLSGSIGRRYVRSDEIGIPFNVTIDYDSLKMPNTVTLRERDTKEQLRIPLHDVGTIIRNLSINKLSWSQLSKNYPKFEKQQSDS